MSGMGSIGNIGGLNVNGLGNGGAIAKDLLMDKPFPTYGGHRLGLCDSCKTCRDDRSKSRQPNTQSKPVKPRKSKSHSPPSKKHKHRSSVSKAEIAQMHKSHPLNLILNSTLPSSGSKNTKGKNGILPFHSQVTTTTTTDGHGTQTT